jgi:hypothetical protein
MLSLPDDIRMAFEDRPGFLQATVSGPRDSRDISLAYWRAIAEECRQRGRAKVLVVEELGDHEGDRDLPSLVEHVLAMGFDRIQVAFVVSRLERLPEMEHGEILALERGAHGRVFANVGPAEHWLRHGL